MFINKLNASRLFLTMVVFVFFITVISAIVAVLISSAVIKNEMNEANTIFLGKLNKLMDNKLLDMDRMLVGFYINNLKGRDISAVIEDYYLKSQLYNAVQELSNTNEFIDSVCIVYNQGRHVYYHSLNNQICETVDLSNFFDKEAYGDFLDGRHLYRILPSRVVSPVYSENAESELNAPARVVTLMKRLPIDTLNTRDALMVNINESYMLDLIGDNYIPKKSMILVSDAQDNTLLFHTRGESDVAALDEIKSQISARGGIDDSQTSFTISANTGRYYVTEFRTSSSNRIYRLITPEKELMKPVYKIIFYLFLCWNFIIILGILFSMVIDKRFFRPVRGILQKLKNSTAAVPGQNHSEAEASRVNEFTQIAGYIDDMISRSKDQKEQLQNYFSFYKERVLQALLYGEDEAMRLQDENKIFANMKYAGFAVVLVNHVSVSCQDTNKGFPENRLAEAMDKIEQQLKEYGNVEKVRLNQNKYAFLICMQPRPEFCDLGTPLKFIISDMDVSRVIQIGTGSICSALTEISRSYREAQRSLQYILDSGKASVLSFSEFMALCAADAGCESRKLDENNKELIDRATKYIDTHYMQEIGLNTIAEYVYLSPSYFGKLFKEGTGYTFTDYLIKVRMEAAGRFLKKGNLKIAEVYERVGYASLQSFSKIFKGYYNCTPGEYRRQSAVDFLEDG